MANDVPRSAGSRPRRRPATGLPDWRWLAHSTRPNGLLIGPSAMTGRVLRQLKGSLRSPVLHWPRDGDPWQNWFRPPTVILHQVTTLTPDDQRSLLAWLEDAGRHVQLISVASQRVYPLVENGAFLAALYYRINCIVVDCVRATPRPARRTSAR